MNHWTAGIRPRALYSVRRRKGIRSVDHTALLKFLQLICLDNVSLKWCSGYSSSHFVVAWIRTHPDTVDDCNAMKNTRMRRHLFHSFLVHE